MKKSALILGLGFTAMVGLSAFAPAEKHDESKTTSVVHWTGSKVVGGEHTGLISIKESKLEFQKDKLVGGMVVVDMTTITNTDLDGEWNQKLVGHLNSDDFFSTAKYPTSTLKITKVTDGESANTYNVTADVTIKGITHSQSFVSTVAYGTDNYTATAVVNIDRTKYGVRYGSSSFFDDLGDKAIENDFKLKVTITASK